jgi:acetylglutamate kinase
MTPEALDAARATIAEGAIPLLSLEAAKDANADGRVKMLATLAASLAARRVIFLSRGAGLGPRQSPPLSVISLGNDYDQLVSGNALSRRQTTLLRQVKQLLEQVPHRMSVAVVNPLHLLRELFTVTGAGTLIRRGSRIDTRVGWADVDQARLRALFHSAFGKVLRADFFETPIERTYIEEGYLGAAVIREAPVGVYLTKFAVERQAQGEGIGGEIWSMMVRDYPSFFWRARPTNPINPWYTKQCDGMSRFGDWIVYWRGMAIERIDPAIRYALSEPTDLR